jgi:hypothetical protein
VSCDYVPKPVFRSGPTTRYRRQDDARMLLVLAITLDPMTGQPRAVLDGYRLPLPERNDGRSWLAVALTDGAFDRPGHYRPVIYSWVNRDDRLRMDCGCNTRTLCVRHRSPVNAQRIWDLMIERDESRHFVVCARDDVRHYSKTLDEAIKRAYTEKCAEVTEYNGHGSIVAKHPVDLNAP